MTDHAVPTKRLDVVDVDNADAEIREFAQSLVDAGERPWFEVWYPKPEHYAGTAEEWEDAQSATFDAVELVDGEIVTLPPYAEIEAAS